MSARGGRLLAARLERRFVTMVDRVTLGSWPVDILRPRSAEELISEQDFERDERLPYWADIWPSSVVLGTRLVAAPSPSGMMLELGCGVGVVTVAAMHAGHDVLATDYYRDALRFTRANAWRATGREPRTRLVDWRALPANLGTFDYVVAADVLYERPYASLVAEAIARTLRPTGTAYVADPGRVGAERFLDECAGRRLVLVRQDRWPFTSGAVRQTVTVFTLRPHPAGPYEE